MKKKKKKKKRIRSNISIGSVAKDALPSFTLDVLLFCSFMLFILLLVIFILSVSFVSFILFMLLVIFVLVILLFVLFSFVFVAFVLKSVSAFVPTKITFTLKINKKLMKDIKQRNEYKNEEER